MGFVKIKEEINYYTLELTDEEFRTIQELVEEETGIFLNPAKRLLVKNRLRGALRTHGFESYGAYARWVRNMGSATELMELIASITTTKTEFFRNKLHVDFFIADVLPELVDRLENNPQDEIVLWSAGCSSGEEPYTLAIIVNERVPAILHKRIRIVASDINHKVLETARAATYDESRVKGLSSDLRERYFRSGSGATDWRLVPGIRQAIELGQVNLVDQDTWPSFTPTVIFCRNVLIYMTEKNRVKVIEHFVERLEKGGFLFLGHSETLHGTNVTLEYLNPAVYRKDK